MRRLALASLLLLTSPAVLADSFILSCTHRDGKNGSGSYYAPVEIAWDGKQLQTSTIDPISNAPKVITTPVTGGRLPSGTDSVSFNFSFRLPEDPGTGKRRLRNLSVLKIDNKRYMVNFAWATLNADGLLLDVFDLTATNCEFASK